MQYREPCPHITILHTGLDSLKVKSLPNRVITPYIGGLGQKLAEVDVFPTCVIFAELRESILNFKASLLSGDDQGTIAISQMLYEPHGVCSVPRSLLRDKKESVQLCPRDCTWCRLPEANLSRAGRCLIRRSRSWSFRTLPCLTWGNENGKEFESMSCRSAVCTPRNAYRSSAGRQEQCADSTVGSDRGLQNRSRPGCAPKLSWSRIGASSSGCCGATRTARRSGTRCVQATTRPPASTDALPQHTRHLLSTNVAAAIAVARNVCRNNAITFVLAGSPCFQPQPPPMVPKSCDSHWRSQR